MATETNLAIDVSNELEPPPEVKRKDKKWRTHPRPGSKTKRGPPRPHRRIPEDVLNLRIKKLTERMEKARKQHEDARGILTKYSHERTYRLRESLLNTPADQEPVSLPEFETVQALKDDAATVPSGLKEETLETLAE
jgi:hypothetical protein